MEPNEYPKSMKNLMLKWIFGPKGAKKVPNKAPPGHFTPEGGGLFPIPVISSKPGKCHKREHLVNREHFGIDPGG